EIRETLPKDNPEYQSGLADTYRNLAILQENNLNDFKSAETNYNKAIEIREMLPKDNPEYQSDLADAYVNLANLQFGNLNNCESAETNYNKAIEIKETLPKDNPDYQNYLASMYCGLAFLQQDHLGDYNSAKSNIEKAIAIYEQLPKDNATYQNDLAGLYNQLAYIYDKLSNYDKAIIVINIAIDIASKLKEKDSKYMIWWLAYRHTLSEIKYNNGKDLDEVKNTLLEIQPLAQQCLKDNPDDEWTKQTNDDIADLLSKIGN
ncbi:MAG: tetratricopeptide repeat protein, partial [Bacteroidales bacterium]|nr:tetratricopeptide repeat protein [Bacteroidales bacterium]